MKNTSKRVIQSNADIYKFSNVEEGMLIEKNNIEVGVYPNFEVGDNLEGDYLIELAQEFENID